MFSGFTYDGRPASMSYGNTARDNTVAAGVSVWGGWMSMKVAATGGYELFKRFDSGFYSRES